MSKEIYFIGKVCNKCCGTMRYIRTGYCVTCAKARVQRARSKIKKEGPASTRRVIIDDVPISSAATKLLSTKWVKS